MSEIIILQYCIIIILLYYCWGGGTRHAQGIPAASGPQGRPSRCAAVGGPVDGSACPLPQPASHPHWGQPFFKQKKYYRAKSMQMRSSVVLLQDKQAETAI